MCGIGLIISAANNESQEQIAQQLWSALSRRGPDAGEALRFEVCPCMISSRPRLTLDVQVNSYALQLQGHVLHLRGKHTVQQPFVGADGDVALCWNGEVFGCLDVRRS